MLIIESRHTATRATYAKVAEWEEKAKSLAAKYIKNFEQYLPEGKDLLESGPQL